MIWEDRPGVWRKNTWIKVFCKFHIGDLEQIIWPIMSQFHHLLKGNDYLKDYWQGREPLNPSQWKLETLTKPWILGIAGQVETGGKGIPNGGDYILRAQGQEVLFWLEHRVCGGCLCVGATSTCPFFMRIIFLYPLHLKEPLKNFKNPQDRGKFYLRLYLQRCLYKEREMDKLVIFRFHDSYGVMQV